MKEFDFASVERKFVGCVSKVMLFERSSPPREGFYSSQSLSMEDAGVFSAGRFTTNGVSFENIGGYVDTDAHPLPNNIYPRLEFQYWIPSSGIYTQLQANGKHFPVMIRRKMGRFFRCGVSGRTHAYRMLVSPIASLTEDYQIDFTRIDWNRGFPIVKNDFVLSDNLSIVGGELMFKHFPIGLANPPVLFLNDKRLESLIPPEVRELWQITL